MQSRYRNIQTRKNFRIWTLFTQCGSKTVVQSSLDQESSQNKFLKKIAGKKCAWLQEEKAERQATKCPLLEPCP